MGLGIGRALRGAARTTLNVASLGHADDLISGFEDISGQRNADKATAAQQHANMLERKRASLQMTRERRKLVSSARVAQSQNILNAILSGGGASSAAQGVAASTRTDTATRIGEASQDFAFTTGIQQYESESQRQQGKSQEKQGLFQTGLSLASSFAGL